MLFSEVYGTYYNVLAEILKLAVDGTLTKQQLYRIVQEQGFEESILTIPQMLKDQSWPLIGDDMTTPLEDIPSMPLTLLQKRWLKTLLQDPRVKLFAPSAEGLEEVQPLYPPDSILYFDRYLDGDPYTSADYIRNFRTILSGIREKCWIQIEFIGGKGMQHSWRCIPHRLEYSSKDDKFRLLCADSRGSYPLNLARISACTLLEPYRPEELHPIVMAQKILILELTDERNALERCMLNFSHLRKETQRLEENRYRVKLYYELADETELLIRVLSFGPLLKVVFPQDFRERLVQRLKNQKNLRTPE